MTSTFGNIFYDDFYNAKWATTPGIVREITWSIENTQLILPTGEYVTATASLDYHRNTIRNAFSIWDKELDSISFVESNNGNNADITLSATGLDGVDGSSGWWYYNWDGNKNITKATIQFDSADLHNGWLMTTAMHEIGNILGLGDIYSSNSIKSVQEDPFPEKFLGNELWEDDKTLLSQIYPKATDSFKPANNDVYRFFNANGGVHFYTGSRSERDNIISRPEWGYRYEGVAYEALGSGGTELYRFFNRDKGYHFMTVSSKEADLIIGKPEWGYAYEGRSFEVSTRETAATPTEVHRFYHEGKGIHFYSANEVEANNVISKSLGNGYNIDNAINNDNLLGNGWGYVYEGVAWYVADL